MAFLCVETEKDQIVKEYMTGIEYKLKDNNVFSNPWPGGIVKVIPNGDRVIYLIKATLIYPPFYWFGVIGALVPIALTGRATLWALPGALFFALGFLWSKWFIYIILRIQLRRKKYRGLIRIKPYKVVLASIIENKVL